MYTKTTRYYRRGLINIIQNHDDKNSNHRGLDALSNIITLQMKEDEFKLSYNYDICKKQSMNQTP